MEETETHHKKTDWHSRARKGTLLAKLLIYLCLFIMLAYWTASVTSEPYSICLIGIELALALSSALTTIRLGSEKPYKKYINPGLNSKDKQLINLLSLINKKSKEYNQSADYYFSGVRIFKYTTMILSGISTILLGLNLRDIFKTLKIDPELIALYPDIAKNIAFIIGAVITVYTGIMTYWNIEKYWLQNRNVANKLITLKEEIENEDQAKTLTPEMIQAKYEKYATITGDYFKYWEGALAGRAAQEKS
jgi:Protein of unknown function (DUF4231)